MDTKKRMRVAILIALIMVAAVFGSFGYSLYSIRSAQVTLPSPSVQPGTPPPDYHEQILQVDITPKTVQSAIASLDRCKSYTRSITVLSEWPGGSRSTTSHCWVDAGYTLTHTALPTGQVRYTLSDGNQLYYWYSGSSSYLTAPPNTLSADLAQRIPTYEDVLDLAPESITDAGYRAYGDHLCIYVETRQDDLGYVERYWVGVDTGLLVAAETIKGDAIVYSVNASATVQTPCPSDVRFSLPDGTVLHQPS